MQSIQLLRAALLLVLSGAVVAPAAATATYASAAHSIFTIAPLGPVSSIVDHMPASTSSTVGNATAVIDTFLASPDGVHPVTVDLALHGSAAYAPDSFSFASAERGHVLLIPRVSPSGPLPTVTLRFSFEMFWETHLSLDRPGYELAAGGAYFALSGFEGGIDSISFDDVGPGHLVPVFPDGSNGWEFNPSDLLLASGSSDKGGHFILTGSITVLAGMVGAFSVITDAAGRAGSIPEPATWLLLAPLLALRLRRANR